MLSFYKLFLKKEPNAFTSIELFLIHWVYLIGRLIATAFLERISPQKEVLAILNTHFSNFLFFVF
jgi:fucose permease